MSGVEAAGIGAARRAARLLARPGAWLEADGAAYVVRGGKDRRRRPLLRLDEAGFRALAAGPGLRLRPSGGWGLVTMAEGAPSPPPGRPGVVEGERPVIDPGGRVAIKRANLGQSALLWLATHKGPDGAPWISPLELQAGERLRADIERAGLIGRLTMDWGSAPRSSAGRGPGLEPAERARAAKARAHAALAAVGPRLAPMLERVCATGSALQAAERALGMAPRTGRAVLKAGLERLVAHYRMG